MLKFFSVSLCLRGAKLPLAPAMFAALLAIAALAHPEEPQPPKTSEGKPAAAALLHDALQLYRAGRWEDAAAKYQAALAQDANSAAAYAGLARCYLKEGKVQSAYDTATKAVKRLPDFQTAHVSLGEVYFRQGKMHDAEKEFLGVVDSEAPEARAYLGLARVADAVSMHAWARQMLAKAHALDPDDAEIEWRWLNTLPAPKRVKALSDDLTAGKIEDASLIAQYKAYLAALQQEKQPARACKLVSGPSAVEENLWPIFTRPSFFSGYGLDVKINGRGSRLLLDTGVSGILLSPAKAARAGIMPRSQSKIVGIGNRGEDVYIGYADSIRIGPLEFRNCPVEVSAKEAAGHDGLLGPDLFSRYLVTLDFPGGLLKLSALPKPPDEKASDDPPGGGPSSKPETTLPAAETGGDDDDQEAPDRYLAPAMESYTKVLRFGHMLLVPTHLNDFPAKLFLLDTGSDHTYISLEAAREVTKVHKDPDTRVIGINGPVRDVYRADNAKISFGDYKQDNQDLVVFDLSGLSQETGTEISGHLGLALLRLLKITIDYRDGLVDFSYDSRRVH